jgi:hypothetical protein
MEEIEGINYKVAFLSPESQAIVINDIDKVFISDNGQATFYRDKLIIAVIPPGSYKYIVEVEAEER